MKPKDVKNDNKRVYIDEHNEKDSRFKVGDRVRISKFKNIFAKGYTPNWSKEIFIVDKTNDTVSYTYNIKDLNDKEIIGSFYGKELIAGVTKNTLDNLRDITKLKAVDTSNFVLKTKLASVTTLENKIDTVDKKIPDISGLATKTSLISYLQTATFNSKVTEVENKIKDTDIIAKSANTKANTIRSDLIGYAKKLKLLQILLQ